MCILNKRTKEINCLDELKKLFEKLFNTFVIRTYFPNQISVIYYVPRTYSKYFENNVFSEKNKAVFIKKIFFLRKTL